MEIHLFLGVIQMLELKAPKSSQGAICFNRARDPNSHSLWKVPPRMLLLAAFDVSQYFRPDPTFRLANTFQDLFYMAQSLAIRLEAVHVGSLDNFSYSCISSDFILYTSFRSPSFLSSQWSVSFYKLFSL